MRARTIVSVVLAAGILLGTSGCNLFAPQSTTAKYDASDGVSGDVGDLAIRNAILLSEEGAVANLVVTVVNSGDTAQSLNVQYDDGSDKVNQKVNVDANSSVTLGTEDAPTVTVTADLELGSLFPVFFQYGGETGVEVLVPVLDGSLGEYSTLLPTPAP
ncbi:MULTISPECIES: DNA modification methylase [Cryobacterium]|uniref:DNA modification methylase n=1 Tax=Cryobacterium breve TaxID=1259258 RepID=A0ABY2J701_9MICO|nr:MULTISPECIES: DNA modification methylase [Cryobacterium]TFC96275.1 DNA modification methylase [Cryobacterium sp. TmT3-12]TFD00720.1 DNA modification methylase [Cryobacterium breve]